ncbi:unnamed protein product [Amoebophrya sp. A120]|nr:unnamed protein product [Amoebophrya sp. A120]|eukprot:GSA120T00015455001.1
MKANPKPLHDSLMPRVPAGGVDFELELKKMNKNTIIVIDVKKSKSEIQISTSIRVFHHFLTRTA